MKRPRQVLLQRHSDANAPLDRVRENVLRTLAPAAQPGAEPPWRIAWLVWQELILPSRFAWAGMAALWLVLLLVHLQISSPSPKPANTQSARRAGLSRTFVEQRRLLAELLQSPAPAPADQPPSKPQPRSERPVRWKAC